MAKTLGDLHRIVVQVPRRLRNESEQIVREVVKEAGEDMYLHTNRIDTELMKGSISHGDFERSGGSYSGKFGWGLDGGWTEDYFLYQEEGTAHISPMHALQGSFIRARERFIGRIEAMLRKAL